MSKEFIYSYEVVKYFPNGVIEDQLQQEINKSSNLLDNIVRITSHGNILDIITNISLTVELKNVLDMLILSHVPKYTDDALYISDFDMTYHRIKNLGDADDDQDAITMGQVVRLMEVENSLLQEHVHNDDNPHSVSLDQVLKMGNKVCKDIDMGGYKLISLSDGTSDGEAVTYNQFITLLSKLESLTLEDVRCVSSKVQGPIYMNMNKIKELSHGSERGDAVEFEQYEVHVKDVDNPHLVTLEQSRSLNNKLLGGIDMFGNEISNVGYLDTEFVFLKNTNGLDIVTEEDSSLLYSSDNKLYYKDSTGEISCLTDKPIEQGKQLKLYFQPKVDKSTTSSDKLTVFEVSLEVLQSADYKLSWSCELLNTNRHATTLFSVETAKLGGLKEHNTSLKRGADMIECCTGFHIMKNYNGDDIIMFSIAAHSDIGNTAKIKNLSVMFEEL